MGWCTFVHHFHHLLNSFRVVNVLRHWVDFHYYDYQRDQELLTRLHTFITSVKGKKMQKWVAALNRALDKVYTYLI
jgi:son of sevenless-like protein